MHVYHTLTIKNKPASNQSIFSVINKFLPFEAIVLSPLFFSYFFALLGSYQPKLTVNSCVRKKIAFVHVSHLLHQIPDPRHQTQDTRQQISDPDSRSQVQEKKERAGSGTLTHLIRDKNVTK